MTATATEVPAFVQASVDRFVAFLCDLDDVGRITELSGYCTGDWDEAAVARHAEAVTLLRP